MAALAAGTRAPDLTLPTLEGSKISLHHTLQKGPVVLAFFKVSCPVCQYTFPFLERLWQAYKDADVTFLGISQDNVADTKQFLRQFGVTFPVVLDDSKGYAVSNAYGLTTVPSIFYVSPSAEIEMSIVGWSKTEIEAINGKLAQLHEQAAAPLWRKGEQVQDFRAG